MRFFVEKVFLYVNKGFMLLRKRGIRYVLLKIQQKKYNSKLIKQYKTNISSDILSMDNDNIKEHYLISVIVPVYNTCCSYLTEMIESVEKQIYDNWELCLVDASDDEHGYVGNICKKKANCDYRIKYFKLDKNNGISENTNYGFSVASGEYIALLDHDDILDSNALMQVANVIDKKNADFVYTDELTFKDKIENIVSINYKQNYGIDNLRALNYICHLVVFKKSLLQLSGEYRKEYDGSQDHDLFLRLCQNAERIEHIDKVLYYWRYHSNSVSADIYSKTYAIDAGKRAVLGSITNSGLSADIESTPVFPTLYRLRYVLKETPLISIIIDNRFGNNKKLNKCIKLIKTKSTYSNYELFVISNKDVNVLCDDKIKYVKYSKDLFSSFKEVLNISKGTYILYLNDSIQVCSDRWIEEMLMYAQRMDVGAVGALIVNKADKIIDAGNDYDYDSSMKKSYLYNTKSDSLVDNGRLYYARNVIGISGKCAMMRKSVLKELFDKSMDDDSMCAKFCKKLNENGYSIVITPYAKVKLK